VIRRCAHEWQAEGHIDRVIESQGLDRDQRLIVIHRKRHVVARARGRMEERVRWQRAAGIDTFRPEPFDGGMDQRQILVAQRAIFARMGIEACDRKPRTRNTEALVQVASNDAAGLHHEVGRELGDDLLERKVDGDGHDRELGRP